MMPPSPARRLLLGLALLIGAGCAHRHQLVLYETAPTETTLDHADLPEAHKLWLDRITAAQHSIDLSHFYASVRPGGRLEPVLLALESAAARGVKVRFLADEKFYGTYPETLDRLATRDGIEVRRLDLGERTGGVQHAKYMTIDGERVLFGSQNFDWRSLEHVQELGAEVDHPVVVDAFEHVFAVDWALAGGADQVFRRDAADAPLEVWYDGHKVLVEPVFSPRTLLPDPDTWDLPRIEAMIDQADRRIRIQLLSYKTHDYDGSDFVVLDRAIRRAAARGVQVQLLLADWSKKGSQIGTLKELQQVANMEVRLVTIPEHSSGFIPFARVIHAKYMVVDSELAWLGTSNWSGDYFYKSRNVGIIVDGEPFAERLDAFFEDLWDSSYAETVDPAREYQAPRTRE